MPYMFYSVLYLGHLQSKMYKRPLSRPRSVGTATNFAGQIKTPQTWTSCTEQRACVVEQTQTQCSNLALFLPKPDYVLSRLVGSSFVAFRNRMVSINDNLSNLRMVAVQGMRESSVPSMAHCILHHYLCLQTSS